MHTQLAVLGGGPGGYAAAFLAADLGMDVTIIDKEPNLGGVCLLRGCIPSKALLHVARVIGETREMEDWGVQFGKPKISIDALRARKQKVIDTLTGGLAQLAKKRGIKIVHAKGTFEDSTRIRLDGGTPSTHPSSAITFDHVIVATGSRPVVPKPFELSGRVMNSTGALELKDIPENLLVIGGGYIGLEMGTVYGELGSNVTVVEMLDRLLPGADKDLVRPLERKLKNLFADIHLETKVSKIDDKGDNVEVTFEGKHEGKQTFDRVLICIGRRPNTDSLGLEKTKVKITDKGFIEVDDRQRTADKRILAIGDVTGDPMLAHKASREGKVAVEALAGEPAAFDNMTIPAVVFTDPEIAWAGLTEAQAKEQGRDVQVSLYPWGASGRAQAVGRTEGLTKFIIDPKTERILGVGMVGINVGELIGETVLAIEMGCSVSDITATIHPHPTLSETLPNAGEVFFGVATEVYKPKRKSKSE
jgi:dihydrolipoamide dehydrogenase